ncbi:hypothetical protein [Campylobacter jejuni]|nr:hypothetical protein [Campylobacter jejuni]EDP7295268.1 hypothetical protein [Campylobacter jejuni]EEO9346037.1 hypothetical protein [Campylobacter jejuni]EFO9534508.1 hypothetical protein [Campylobacter jejuni]EFO9538014.1 hypothetical protein [Campylobacter jejuni]EFO9556755.1 hypothetical protein [Campylobacter jejuni]
MVTLSYKYDENTAQKHFYYANGEEVSAERFSNLRVQNTIETNQNALKLS